MTGKTIVLGIGGGIAAYKVADLASKLTQQGADVHAVLTESATRFIAPLTFTALTHNPAQVDLWPHETEASKSAGMPHIALADKADLILIAPASADLIARLAGGFANDLLTTLVTATRAPIALAPAMNPTMLARPATQRNLAQLQSDGFHIIQPDEGRMACEHVGSGRLPETPELIAQLEKILFPNRDLEGKRVLITAGPTRENLDPVRFISNRSSGKMGYALAEEARSRGARVTLVSGPTSLATPQGAERINVQSALEMRDATIVAFENCDILIACAAPADFRAANQATQKIKRGDSQIMHLELVANPDIVRECGTRKRPNQIVVGFAAETHNVEAEARRKMLEKNLDAIIANDVTREGAGFDSNSNAATFYSRSHQTEWPLMPKTTLASKIWDEVARLPTAKN
ncbi:coenzyme A biosynthesis bifunctional protein CoaBC [Abditibacteriota bacterium]|nr:coenzyme A biosynthesis bifunctional protein CoaBC [Abditibacteriota bacterium]